MQISHFLKLDPGPLAELVYACALQCGASQHSESSAQALELLRGNPDMAELVLTAPCARQGTTPLSLPQLFAALPSEFRAAGARGFFGVDATMWLLDFTSWDAAQASVWSTLTLPQQPRVTALKLGVDHAGLDNLFLLRELYVLRHITAVSVQSQVAMKNRTLGLLTLHLPIGLRHFEIRGLRIAGRALADLLPSLLPTRQLTSLVLEGECVDEGVVTDEAGIAALAAFLPQMTALVHLGLPQMQICGVGASTLGRELPNIPRLRSLDLRDTDTHYESDAVALGIAACVGLTSLDLTGCCLGNSALALCGTQAPLQKLQLEGTAEGLSYEDVQGFLVAPTLCLLTCLHMSNIYADDDEVVLLWEPLCALTLLRELVLTCNGFGDACAAALAVHIGALAQLRALDISYNDITTAGALGREIFRLPHLMQLASEQQADDCGRHSEPAMRVFEVPEAAAQRGLTLVRCIERAVEML